MINGGSSSSKFALFEAEPREVEASPPNYRGRHPIAMDRFGVYFLLDEGSEHTPTVVRENPPLNLSSIKSENLRLDGPTGAVLDRALVGMRTLIDRTLAHVRITAGLAQRNDLFGVADFVEELRLSASLEAKMKGCAITFSGVAPRLGVRVDRDLLLSAVGNLLQNAIKFTRPDTEVILRAYSVGDRILIEVEDHGEGLPAKEEEKMFHPFVQGGTDKSGMGLGLSICRQSVKAIGGILSARNHPHSGCLFTISLPRYEMPAVEG